jgi:transposase InsO family protein
LARLCQFFERTRQAYYQLIDHSLQLELWDQLIVAEVKKIRRRQPKVGTRKLHRMVNKQLKSEGIQIGRDRLFKLLRTVDLLVPRRKRGNQTTDSRHRLNTYGNLIRDLQLTRPNQVYVSDITYVETLLGFCYLALITDAYSRKIVGYDLSRSLSVEGSLRALEMALKQLSGPIQLIHHSDRGLQYCSHVYADLLRTHGVQISMTEERHVYENAKAERVNGILKSEFLLGDQLASFEVAEQLVKEAIQIYNEERLHLSLDYQTPAMVHDSASSMQVCQPQ